MITHLVLMAFEMPDGTNHTIALAWVGSLLKNPKP
jgi:hypothetical protein